MIDGDHPAPRGGGGRASTAGHETGRLGAGTGRDVRIYVQIPAYRDDELWPTLRDLYATAARPAELRVGVVWQHAPDEAVPADLAGRPRLEIIEVDAATSPGCNWARRLLQDRSGDEPYTLLLDSHHRFVSEWDRRLIEMHDGLVGSGIDRPLITAYLPAYVPGVQPPVATDPPLKIYAKGREDGVLTKLTSYPIPGWRSQRRPVGADFPSLHFMFGPGSFNRDVPADPELYFFGDEVALGLRVFTRGYDMVHPHVVLGWHAYDRTSRVPHWNDHTDWRDRHQRSLDRLRRLFRGLPPEAAALGTVRTIADYERRIMTALVQAP